MSAVTPLMPSSTIGDFREDGLDIPEVMPVNGHDPGIYLYLPAPQHHDDPSIGSGGHRRLRSHPCEFFHSWAGNPKRTEEPDTPARLFGRAVHKVVLEGEAALEREFGCEPVGEWPNLLRTMDDMKRLLKPAGLAVSGVKEELTQRVRNAFPKALIYDEIMDEHRRYNRSVLKVEAWSRVIESSAHISMHPQLRRAFMGGKSEVSIFWVNPMGVRCKARLDYLRILNGDKGRLTASVTDLKSFSMPRQIPVERAVDNAAGENIHQAAHYIDAVKAMILMLRQGGTEMVRDARDEDREWLELLTRCKTLQFNFVFYKSSGAPYADATVHEPGDELITAAGYGLDTNYKAFRRYYEHFGTDLWINLGEPRRLSGLEDIKPWYL